MRELLSLSSNSLEVFLTRWYGEPDLLDRVVDVEAYKLRVPKPLVDWLSLASRWSHDIVSLSGPVDPPELVIDGGKVVFWMADQGECEWAFESGSDDPLIYQRLGASHWKETHETLSQFLLHVTVLDAGLAGAQFQCYSHGVQYSDLREVIAGYEPFPLEALDGSSISAQVYVGGDSLLLVTQSMSDISASSKVAFDLILAASLPAALEDVVSRYSGVDWRRHYPLKNVAFNPSDLPSFFR